MTITVVIPLYNKKDTVLRALNSVFNQQVLPNEVIVVNDGSTDGSEKEVENLNNPLITLVHQKNKGVSAARNKGIEFAKSDWIAFLDADDIWKPYHLSEMKMLQSLYPFCNVLGSGYETMNSEGVVTPIILNKIPFEGNHGVLSNYFEVASCSNPPLWSSAVVIKKIALIEVNGFAEGVTTGEDLLTWAKLACQNKIAYNIRVSAIYHFYSIKEWILNARKQDEVDVVGNSLEKLLQTCGGCKDLKKYIAIWHRMRLNNYMKMGYGVKARIELVKVFKYSKTDYKSIFLFFVALMPERVRMYLIDKRNRGLKNA